MAVEYASVATASFQTLTSGSNLTITKPSGLAAGDIMVVHLSSIVASGTNGNWDTPSGWTALTNTNQTADSNSKARLTTFFKVADSSDASASSFDFTTNTATAMCGGSLYRITGGATVQGTSASATGTTSPSFGNTITPDYANSLMLFLTTCADAGQTTGSVSGYAIATDNPTWTERYDFTGDISSRRGIMAGATASRPEVTASGNSSCSYVNYSQNSVGAIVVVSPIVNVTVSPAVVTATVTVQDPTVEAGAVVTPAVVTMQLNVQAPTISNPTPDWVNQDSSGVASVTNQDKT